ncbi:MAG: lamin tail domain-containing protein [Deltaproteobacteria bacterium]|nr:lamin tail domain-containing protein [Deltaproteobacteria bacterium]MCB9788707.1 lamin tail domain-containing protein [Deltaproteobacteria bacterium]
MGRPLLATVTAACLVGLYACADTPCSPACASNQRCLAGTCVLRVGGGDVSGDVGGGSCAAAVAGDLVINEILADPGGVDVNGDGQAESSGDEFIEIVNVAGHAVGLSSAVLKVGDKSFSLGSSCLQPNGARVVYGAESKLTLANQGGTVALEIGGAEVQTHTWGKEADKDQSLTLTVQLDPGSGWSLHEAVAATSWSPGTCANGNAFPDCTGAPPGDAGDVAADVAADAADDTVPDQAGEVGPPCGVAPVAGDLVINEVLADPGTVLDANQSGDVDAGGDEFVEVLNVSGEVLDLTGVKVAEGGGVGLTLPAGTCLAAGQALVVFGRYDGGGDFGGALVFAVGKSFGINNGGDTITVTDASGGALSSLTFTTSGSTKESWTRAVEGDASAEMVGHTTAANAGGAPMSPGRCQGGQPFPDCGPAPIPDPAPDAADGGPGDAGPDAEVGPEVLEDADVASTCGVEAGLGQLVLNEILSDPGGNDVNGDGNASATQDEFIELVNLTDQPLELAGVSVLAGPPGAPVASHTFTSLCLEPHAGVVLFSGGTPSITPPLAVVLKSQKALGLNNGGETVVLRAADGSDIDSYAFTELSGQSWVRSPDGSGAFTKHATAAGSGGAPYSPGTCVDGSALPSCLQ